MYDEKNSAVRVFGPFDPEQLKRHLLCKFPKIIKGIDIIEPPKPEPPKPKTPPKDPFKERYMKHCEEDYEDLAREVEKCKKECEEKFFQRRCKCKCKCSCDDKKPKDQQKEPEKTSKEPEKTSKEPEKSPKEPEKLELPIHLLCPPQFPTVCCGRPCPCFEAWSNNYKCCSCGVVSWPSSCGSGWGTGPGSWGHQHLGCEPGRSPTIVFESSPPCIIM
jgi:hypothetical protein